MIIEIAVHEAELAKIFNRHFGTDPDEIRMIPPSGSERIYFILQNGQHRAVGAYNPDLRENRTYFYFTELFLKYKLPVPELYFKDNHKGYYLLEYKEGPSLLDMLKQDGYTEEVKDIYKHVLEYLVRFQLDILEEVDFSMCHSAQEFDQNQILSDLLYFKYYFLDMQRISYDKTALMEELQEMAGNMAAVQPKTFMYRDFQSRNILVDDHHQPAFIDYQGGMKGLPQYDVVSLLWQARAELPEDWKRELFNHYYKALTSSKKWVHINEIEFRKTYLDCVLLRMLQTLGAYGFRGLIEGKDHFLKSIYPALKQLRSFIDEHPRHPSFQELRTVLEQITSDRIIEKYNTSGSLTYPNTGRLKVKIYSFSFKKGTAADLSGNGGGFVFDCRGILNPGREEIYRTKTGRDIEVIQYLESKTKMPQFLRHVFDIVDTQVEDFLQRGFEDMMLSFGCTGGQHRSVYAAERTAAHLREKYGIEHIEVLHMEQSPHDRNRAFGGQI